MKDKWKCIRDLFSEKRSGLGHGTMQVCRRTDAFGLITNGDAYEIRVGMLVAADHVN